jgi:hypothetical protein
MKKRIQIPEFDEELRDKYKGDPVFRTRDGKWHFYEETWAHTNGPYDTEAECDEALNNYGRVLLDGS